MAKITDPDLLNQGTEVDFITGSLAIKLNRGQGAMTSSNGLASDAGVSLQTLYSFIKEEWKNDNNLIKFPFPMISITSEQFEFINGWNLSGSAELSSSGTSTVALDPSASHWLVKDGGWAVIDPNTGANSEEWMNITTLGAFDDSTVDQAYFVQIDPTNDANYLLAIPSASVFPGEVNQGIQIYATASFDYRDYFNIFLREESKTYANYDLLAEQNLTALTYRKYALPLANGNDLKVTSSDAGIDPDQDGVPNFAPYSGMSITYYTSSQARTIGGTPYNFDVIIDGNQGTAEQIYEFVQFSLRQQIDIDAGDNYTGKRGEVQGDLLQFIGDTLRTEQGVYIDDFQSADTNRIEFVDNTGTVRTFPFVAAGTLLFNDNLQNDANAIYKVFFTNDDTGDNTGRDFGTQNAIILEQNTAGNLLTGSVATSASVAFDYDYDNNIQRGTDSSGSDVPFTAVALGLGTAQYVVTTGTITRAVGQTVNFVAALERNYLNP